jgi:hypothetical protein
VRYRWILGLGNGAAQLPAPLCPRSRATVLRAHVTSLRLEQLDSASASAKPRDDLILNAQHPWLRRQKTMYVWSVRMASQATGPASGRAAPGRPAPS